MKNKLAALLAALLLYLPTLPSQAFAFSDSVEVDPPAISEQEVPETLDVADGLEEIEPPFPLCVVQNQTPAGPDWPVDEH